MGIGGVAPLSKAIGEVIWILLLFGMPLVGLCAGYRLGFEKGYSKGRKSESKALYRRGFHNGYMEACRGVSSEVIPFSSDIYRENRRFN